MNGTFEGMVRGFSPWMFRRAILVSGRRYSEPSVVQEVEL